MRASHFRFCDELVAKNHSRYYGAISPTPDVTVRTRVTDFLASAREIWEAPRSAPNRLFELISRSDWYAASRQELAA